MSEIAIQAEGLGKRYIIGDTQNREGFSKALQLLTPNWRPSGTQELWALRDASMTIRQGESVGIIGRNGAGKSTLLKLLSRITAPTEGTARIQGRVGTLLEVGTGFHPELTGRDNIFLSGTILGLPRAEVARKFDQIVTFSEVEKFIDTPVKRYSSGMYTRLAFAVASFLDPDILIVDEVLAVGDAAFQRKSLGRLNEASNSEGRTILFVSHNLNAIRTFCKRVIVLDKGRIIFDGDTEDGLERYLKSIPKVLDVSNASLKDRLNRTSGDVRFTGVVSLDQSGKVNWRCKSGGVVRLRFDYEAYETVPDLMFLIQLRSAQDGQLITTIRHVLKSGQVEKGQAGSFELKLPDIRLRPGEISLSVCLGRVDDVVYYDAIDANVDMPLLTITSDATDKYSRQGIVTLDYRIQETDADLLRV